MFDRPVLFTKARLVLADRLVSDGWLLAADGIIAALGEGAPPQGSIAGHEPDSIDWIDLAGAWLMPGFIELHTHGAGGADFMDGTLEAWQTIAAAHAAHGTTTLLATTLASSPQSLDRALQVWSSWQAANLNQRGRPGRREATIWGLHLEGPYFSPEQAGAQDPRYLRHPDPAEYRRLIRETAGIRRWSAAPELPGGLAFGEYVASQGILVSMAHTNALYEEVVEAVRHGYTLVTHLYSGMSTVRRIDGLRHGGVIESALVLDDLSVEVIADGKHLPAELLQLIFRCKGPGRIALVTDSMRAAGQDVATSLLGSLDDGQPVIIRDGVARMPDGSALAGSVATSDRLLRTMHLSAGVSLLDTVTMMTATPARMLGVQDRKGSLTTGKDADLAILDDDFHVRQTYLAGQRIFPT
jgi:N-acetylglucosamine-6-phosphate deacetylase